MSLLFIRHYEDWAETNVCRIGQEGQPKLKESVSTSILDDDPSYSLNKEFRARVRSQIGLKPVVGEEEKVEANINPRKQIVQPKLMGNIKAEEEELLMEFLSYLEDRSPIA